MKYKPIELYESVTDYFSMQKQSIKNSTLVGIAALVTVLGCNKPIIDMHNSDGTPMKGSIPNAMTGGAPGQEHHRFTDTEIADMADNYQGQGLSLFYMRTK